ncbi:MAG: hypothetical protein ACRD00_05100 [Thermoanaerobaculia bacterium]
MLRSLEDFLSAVDLVYRNDRLPKAFLMLRSLQRLRKGEDPKTVAKEIGSTAAHIRKLAEAPDPIAHVLGVTLTAAASDDPVAKARTMLGQLLLGLIAERAFEGIYRSKMGTSELRLEDDRESRNETDYRVLNGSSRPVFRINIKFHGTRFRKAADLVGLQPDDCFALATYKIYQGLQKQDREFLPYIFAIVGVADLTGARVGESIPDELVHLSALVMESKKVSGKRDVEDRIVLHLLDNPQPLAVGAAITGFKNEIREAEWRVISARKANQLLREKLFDRVFAVRVRAFARNYRNAELDMHFSLKDDLTRLERFLEILKDSGLHGLSVQLERGSL